MDEHDDDLAPEVQEEAVEETEAFANTGDDQDDRQGQGDADTDDSALDLDDDKSEL